MHRLVSEALYIASGAVQPVPQCGHHILGEYGQQDCVVNWAVTSLASQLALSLSRAETGNQRHSEQLGRPHSTMA